MGIQDEHVLDAMDRVPRHYFLDSAFSQFAYSNKAFPIAAGQTISQPHTVAKQSELLGAKPGDNILEIGTGSGYQCAVLCALGFKVHSIERQKALFDTAGPLLKAMGWKPSLYYGDGYKGKPVFAPFDGIIITCGAPDVPQALLGQLKGGRAHGHALKFPWVTETPNACGPSTASAIANSRRRTMGTLRSCRCWLKRALGIDLKSTRRGRLPQIKSTGPKPSRMTSMSAPVQSSTVEASS